MPLVSCTPDIHVNPGHVSSIEWDRRCYNGGPSALVITMLDGRAIRITHQPYALGGIDCHDVERRLLAAALNADREPVEPVDEVSHTPGSKV